MSIKNLSTMKKDFLTKTVLYSVDFCGEKKVRMLSKYLMVYYKEKDGNTRLITQLGSAKVGKVGDILNIITGYHLKLRLTPEEFEIFNAGGVITKVMEKSGFVKHFANNAEALTKFDEQITSLKNVKITNHHSSVKK